MSQNTESCHLVPAGQTSERPDSALPQAIQRQNAQQILWLPEHLDSWVCKEAGTACRSRTTFHTCMAFQNTNSVKCSGDNLRPHYQLSEEQWLGRPSHTPMMLGMCPKWTMACVGRHAVPCRRAARWQLSSTKDNKQAMFLPFVAISEVQVA